MRPETQTALQPLLLDPDGPDVAAIGGGHGLAAALEAIQVYASEITALVTVADDGGSSGRLVDLGIPPPGDLRRCLLALTPEPSIWSELFAHRFESGDVFDHSLGNLIIAGLSNIYGDFETAVNTAAEMLGAVGEVIPVASDPLVLHATIDGEDVAGQALIASRRGEFTDLWIEPTGVVASRRALAAVAEADQIVIGPGSLYTSLIPALKVELLAEAVLRSAAQKVFVLNLVTQDGETLGMSGEDHLSALVEHAGIVGPAVVLANNGVFDVPSGHDIVSIDPERAAQHGWTVVYEDLVAENSDWPTHDPLKLGMALEKLVEPS